MQIRRTVPLVLLLMTACDEDAPSGTDMLLNDMAADLTVGDSKFPPDGKIAPDGKVALDAKVTPDAKVAPDAKLTPDAKVTPDAEVTPDAAVKKTTFVAVTFNTGTSEQMGHDLPPADGYTSAHAKLSDTYYGDGLAWVKAVTATKMFLAKVKPDVIAFQEIFYSAECAKIPKSAHKDFICATWKKGDPTVANLVLGAGFQVACHPGKPDKCAAVRKSFGTFKGCKGDFCLNGGLTGYQIKDCGKGSRVGRGVINLVGGGTMTVVSVHGSSGIDKDSIKCRVKQFEQVFKNLGDGKPAASGKINLVLGDLNTDPGRATLLDKSAKEWAKHAGPGKKFHFLSDVGLLAKPTYAGLFNIDHAVSDVLKGSCWSAGVTAGHPDVIKAVYFDHKPLVCTIKKAAGMP